MARITLRCGAKAPLRTSPQPCQTHHPSNLVTSDARARGHQLGMNPRAAIDTFACFVDAPDLRQQCAVALRPRTLRALPPSVVTARRDTQKATHQTNRIAISAAIDAGALHFDRLAKYAAA